MEWGVTLVGVGRDGLSYPVSTRSFLRPTGDRIDYVRKLVAEWYENSPAGLAQGFTLSVAPEALEGPPAVVEPPRGKQGRLHKISSLSGLAHLDLRVDGTLQPVIRGDGRTADFPTAHAPGLLRYALKSVREASGRELPAWIEGFSGSGFGGLRIVFEDRDAVYPITVNMLATTAVWTAEADQASASFGWSVATAGDVNGDGFSDVIIGATGYDNGQSGEGRAFVYLGSASGPETTPAWTAEGNQSNARFGDSVATAGDVNGDGCADVIVGAPRYGNGETNEGRVFLYFGSAAGPSATADWMVESDQGNARLGDSVAPAGDVNGDGFADVIVAARLFDGGEIDEGRAYIYQGSAAGLSAVPDWTAEGDSSSATFGDEVATAGDVNGDGYADVIVGVAGYDNDLTNEGRAFVYHGSAAGLAATAAWSAEGDQDGAFFGIAVATAGDVNGDGYADVLVGAHLYANGETDEGRPENQSAL